MTMPKILAGVVAAAFLASPMLAACGDTGHTKAAARPSVVESAVPGANHSSYGSGPASYDSHYDPGYSGSTVPENVPSPQNPADTLGVPERPQYDSTLSQIHAIQNQ